MRFLALLPTLALAAPAAAWSDYDWAVKCGRKNPAVNTAIQRFCAKGDIVVPSEYANRGKSHNGFHVAISGSCNPPQWVPTQWCRVQLTKLCANGDGQGLGNQRYGNGGCQGWHIDRRT